ncbi:hypothetical protein Q3G72_008118 [Acer saccharum]|nr:hypothetical protein Q3G72_008118 [Acer saccharum]
MRVEEDQFADRSPEYSHRFLRFRSVRKHIFDRISRLMIEERDIKLESINGTPTENTIVVARQVIISTRPDPDPANAICSTHGHLTVERPRKKPPSSSSEDLEPLRHLVFPVSSLLIGLSMAGFGIAFVSYTSISGFLHATLPEGIEISDLFSLTHYSLQVSFSLLVAYVVGHDCPGSQIVGSFTGIPKTPSPLLQENRNIKPLFIGAFLLKDEPGSDTSATETEKKCP